MMDDGRKKTRPPNPREGANPVSAATFCYTLPTFLAGFRRDLAEEDLYETLSEHRSGRLGDRVEEAWRKEELSARKSGRTPSLRRTLTKVFGFEFLCYGLVLAVTEFAVRMLQPIALGQLIAYYVPHQTEISRDAAYLYAGGVVLCSLVNVFVVHPYMMGVLHLGMKVRVACCSLVYRKALRLSRTALGRTTAGQMVNLLSNDVNRFDVAALFAHQLWLGPLETIAVTYLMYLEVGVSAVVGVAVLMSFVPIQVWLGKRTSVLRLKTAIRTDERVRLMNEIIAGIQVIKMYTWEKPFANLVALARKYEIRPLTGTSYVRGVLLSFIVFTTRITLFVTVFSYVAFGNRITARQVFVVASFYNVLRQTMTVFFPQGIGQVAEAAVSVRRLNDFLLYDENNLMEDGNTQEMINGVIERKLGGSVASGSKGVLLKGVSAKWGETSVLVDVDFQAGPGKLVAVIGPVGGGKSSLLHVILKELEVTRGVVEVCGAVSYASQEPWLFSGTVRQNILFGSAFDRRRYKAVVRRCALERDFALLPFGDRTKVGERGAALSGGQRARINLARAAYKRADVYLLDDPLSAVDAHVGRRLFDECVVGYLLREKTCVLVTHQLQYLKEADRIVIVEGGAVRAEGSYGELLASGLDFARLLRGEEEEGEEKGKEERGVVMEEEVEMKEEISCSRRSSMLLSVSSSTLDLPQSGGGDNGGDGEEGKSVGSVSGRVYGAYFRAGGNWCVLLGLLGLFVVAQAAASAGDYFVTFWVNLEQSRFPTNHTYYNSSLNASSSEVAAAAVPTEVYLVMAEEDVATTNYTTTTTTASPSHRDLRWNLDRDTCIYVYSAITAATVLVTLARSFAFFKVCMRASRRLHDAMFRSVTHATMRFFNANPSGRILNRFSKDMGAVDELLPSALIDVLQIGLSLLGIVVVVAAVNPWLMAPTLFVGVVFYALRIFYLATGKSVKRLEGVTRSPVFSHLNASLHGLTTIRAFRAQQILKREFDCHQDLHSSAWYVFLSTSRAFGFWLDLVCVVYIALVTLSFLVFGEEKYGGNVGLAITQSIGLTGMFQWGMRQSTELENQMTSVERVLEYTDLEQEEPPPSETQPPAAAEKKKKPPSDWPRHGEIRFEGVQLRYAPGEPHVLRNLDFAVRAKEKVGIVGRTGAGKSSLIAALFRLAPIDGGRVTIDGVDVAELGLRDLRSKISIIPQEPVLFSGTLRENLDPFDEYSDAVLWRALEEVELKAAVEESSPSGVGGGLWLKVEEGGSNFSVGQRQLVCLARAAVRDNRILVLDEATANVDARTDALVQATIRRRFAGCTVLTIAHRLDTVMDSDRILVMDAGRAVEFGHAHLLLQKEGDGWLRGMVERTGRAKAEMLAAVAEQSYNNKVQRAQEEEETTS